MIAMLSLSGLFNGFMTPFYWIISSLMVFFHWLFSPVFGASSGVTWLIAVLFMAVAIRVLTLPLYVKQLNSTRAQATLQPKLKALRDKFGSDRQRMGAETMKLYQENGVSPYASCFPMLAQMPVIMSVFWVMNPAARATWDDSTNTWNPQYVPNGMFHGRRDLVESFQQSKIFGSSLSQTFGQLGQWNHTQAFIIVMVIFMMATMFYQQWYNMRRNTPPTMLEGQMGQTTKVMMYASPLMYIVSGMAVPIGVLFYWLVSNVWTLVQQLVMIRLYPTPGTPAYAEWEDRMIEEGKDPAAIERARVERAKSKKHKQQAAEAAKRAAEAADEADQLVVVPGAETVTRTDPTSGRQVVIRQQTRKQSRAKRKR